MSARYVFKVGPNNRLNDVLDLYHATRRTPLEGRTA